MSRYVFLSVGNIFNYDIKIRLTKAVGFNEDDIYFLVFSKEQAKYLEELRKSEQFNILQEFPVAINKVYGHTNSRNTLVMFEYKDCAKSRTLS